MPEYSRREFLGLTAGAVAASLLRPLDVLAADAKPRLNVLFIAVDDLRPALGCYGQKHIHSPNLDRLAAGGMLFERAFCQQAVCAPSRISLLTGLRPDTTGIFDLAHPLRKTKPKVLSLPQHFRQNGYETVSLGKVYHHSRDDNGVGWSKPAWRPSQNDGALKGRGYLTKAAQAAIDSGRRKGVGVGPALECADVADSAYPDGQVADRAVAELKRLKKGDKPFFLGVGFYKPHLPFNAPKKYWDLYDRGKIELSTQKSWPTGMPPYAGMNWGELRGYTDIPDRGRLPKSKALELIHGYYACVSYTDALVGRVLAALDRQGLADDTVVILWGDHGWKLSEYGAWCKHTNFEIDTHVPLLLRVPGGTKGQRTPALVESVDLFPTLAELCGLGVPKTCEGTSMVPLLAEPGRAWKAAAFSQYPRGRRMGYSIRSGRWRYTEWVQRRSGEVRDRELYDHAGGPVAARNLARDPKHADTVRTLSALLKKGQGWRAVREKIGRP
jgi:iduronate 2-sulfatase